MEERIRQSRYNEKKSHIGQPQCHNCRAYGHTKTYYCSHKPRCVKCGDEYLSENCSKDNSLPAKWAVCAGAHTSSYKGCPVYKNHVTLFKKHKLGTKSVFFSRPYIRRTTAIPINAVPTSTLQPINHRAMHPIIYPNLSAKFQTPYIHYLSYF